MKYQTCLKCGKNAVHLAMCHYLEFVGDSDDREGKPSKYSDVEITADEDVAIGCHICFECGELQDIFVESPRDRVAAIEMYSNNRHRINVAEGEQYTADRLFEAKKLIEKAVEIMTPEQVGQWEGVRAWQESV